MTISHDDVLANNVKQNKTGIIIRSSGNLLIVKKTARTSAFGFGDKGRGVIREFTADSGRRMRRYLRECVSNYQFMVTLTYPGEFPHDGAICKDHLRRFIQELKREHSRVVQRGINSRSYNGDFSCFWFFEFQERGAPHYHLFLTWIPSSDWVSRTWYRIVASDDPRHLLAGTRCERLRCGRSGTISYASKYAAKMTQKRVPDDFYHVGRFWGVSGCSERVSAATFITLEQQSDRTVSSRLKAIKDTVKAAVKDGKAKILKKDNDVLLVSLDNINDINIIRGNIELIITHTQVLDELYYNELSRDILL